MSMVIPMASRRAAPTTPTVNAVHPTSRIGTFAPVEPHVDAARMSGMPPGSKVDTAHVSGASELHLIRLHAQACNALHTALRHLTDPDCSPAMWATATARAHRGLSALKQASALANQVGD